MKPKNLRKKIRRLEARLENGAKKLAKLKRKLDAITTADAGKAKRKLAARAAAARQTAKSSTAAQKKGRRIRTKPQAGPEGVKRLRPGKKVKRKLNLSPERRAQLSAAMKARWASKRAVAQANPQDTSSPI